MNVRRLFVALLALTGSACAMPAPEPSQKPAPASVVPWSIVSDARGGMWRLDTTTGQMDYCTMGGDTQLHCWDAPERGDQVLKRIH